MSALGVKRTTLRHAEMSAYDSPFGLVLDIHTPIERREGGAGRPVIYPRLPLLVREIRTNSANGAFDPT